MKSKDVTGKKPTVAKRTNNPDTYEAKLAFAKSIGFKNTAQAISHHGTKSFNELFSVNNN